MPIVIDDNVLRLLEKGADIIISEAKRNVPTKKIEPHIKRDQAKRLSEVLANVRIWVDLDKAPMARAFEKGSGLHGKEQKKYRIAPKNSSALAFVWDKLRSEADIDSTMPSEGKFKGFGSGGKVIMNFVDHPGVVAQSYMTPAFTSKKGEVTTLLRGGLRDTINTQIVLIWNEVMNGS